MVYDECDCWDNGGFLTATDVRKKNKTDPPLWLSSSVIATDWNVSQLGLNLDLSAPMS